jgi:hypothetical protein
MLRWAICFDEAIGAYQLPGGIPMLKEALNSELSRNGGTLLARAVLHGAPPKFVYELITLGADPQVKVSAKVRGQEDTELNLLHLALGNGRLDLVPVLVRANVRADEVSGRGFEPLTYYCDIHTCSPDDKERLGLVLPFLFEAGASLAGRGVIEVTNLEHLLNLGSTDLVHLCLSQERANVEAARSTQFTRRELHHLALQIASDPRISAEPAYEHLSQISNYASGDVRVLSDSQESVSERIKARVSDEEYQQKLSDTLWGALRASLQERDEGAPSRQRLFECIRDIQQHPNLFPREIVKDCLNTQVADEDNRSTFLQGCIRLACQDELGPKELVSLVLQLGADPTAPGEQTTEPGAPVQYRTALGDALTFGALDVANQLIEYGATFDSADTRLRFERELEYRTSEEGAKAGGGLDLSKVSSPEERFLKVAAAYPRLCEAVYGAQQLRSRSIEDFKKLPEKTQFRILAEMPELRFLERFRPEGPNLYLREIVTRLAQYLSKSTNLKTSDLPDISPAEVLLKLVKMGCLLEARLFLKLGAPLPRGYLSGRQENEVPTTELQAIRARLIRDLELLCRTDQFADTLEQLPSSSRSEHDYQVRGPRQDILPLCREILAVDGNVADALKVQSILSVWSANASDRNAKALDECGRDLVELLPRLLFNYPSSVIAKIFDKLHYSSGRVEGFQRNLPEAFSALLHSEITDELRGLSAPRREGYLGVTSIGRLTSAISSFPYLIGHQRVVTGAAVNAWRSIANITHGHRRYRFEAKRQYGVTDHGKPRVELRSYFEACGAKRLPQITNDHPFHSAYVFYGRSYRRRGEAETPAMRGLDDRCVLVRYRAGEVFFDPSIGYIFTRNSSLTFGRDIVRAPLYFVPVAGVMREEGLELLCPDPSSPRYTYKVPLRSVPELLHEIVNLTPEILAQKAYPIMEPRLYFHRSDPYQRVPDLENSRYGIELIAELLQKRERFEAEYRRFLFDTDVTTAWKQDDNGNDILVGAFNSPGFAKWLKRLRAQFEEARDDALLNDRPFTPPHVLECHNPHTLPFSPYARLVLTDEVLSLLEKLAQEGWPTRESGQEDQESSPAEGDEQEREMSELEEEGVYAFLERALRNQAEIVVVANN